MSLSKQEREEFERELREAGTGDIIKLPNGATTGEIAKTLADIMAKKVNQTVYDEELFAKYAKKGTFKPRNKEHRGDGGATHYYELPEGATELRHLIHHKQMEHGIGEAFCALYRLNDNGEYLRNLQKAKFYIECAIEYYEKENE